VSLRTRLEALRPALVTAAQAVVDEWQQDDEGIDEEFGEGGACDAVAQAMAGVLGSIDTMEGGQDGADHAYLIAYDDAEAFVVDIPPGVYERGGGYSWRKIPDAQITEGDIVIERINRSDIDPEMRDNPRGLRLGPGQHLETRGVLGGAYRGKERAYLTHAVIMQGQDEQRVLCSQPLDHLADYYSVSDAERAAPPTCPRCLPRWQKLQMRPNPRRRAAPLTEGDASDNANRRRGGSGRFQRSTPCDFCGKSCAAEHYTDERACGGSDAGAW